jgi:hypothetical protein
LSLTSASTRSTTRGTTTWGTTELRLSHGARHALDLAHHGVNGAVDVSEIFGRTLTESIEAAGDPGQCITDLLDGGSELSRPFAVEETYAISVRHYLACSNTTSIQ